MEEFLQNYKSIFSNEQFENFSALCSHLCGLDETEKVFTKSKDISNLILPLKLDFETYSACMILPYLRENIDLKFDENMTNIFNGSVDIAKTVIKISNLDYTNQQTETENVRSMLIAIAKDIRVMIVKLAEVLYLARHTRELSHEDAEKLHFEIREIYSPIASRLGLSYVKSELNDLNLSYFKPNEYKKLLKQVAEDSRNGKERLDRVIEKIKQIMQNLNIKGDCYGRVKHISSIYNKLKEKGKTLTQIFDLCALRVIVPTQNDCYAILGAIHTEFVPIDSRFKDYIARPKANGYQSLHTVVLVDNEPLEIQIRTAEMHNHAEYGIAAHFLYKEHKSKLDNLDDKLLWIRKLIESKDNENASDLIDSLKTDVYSGEIFVQSPMGKIVQLVEQSTPIDFAYAIHSQVGNKCVGARVNGKMVPLTTPLNNGDVVEIITNQNAKGPSRDWLKFVKTAGTKNKIKQYFRHEMKEENIKKGKSILDLAAKNKGYNLKDLLNDEAMIEVFEKYAFHNEDEMLAAVGYGSVTSTQIINKLVDAYKKNQPQTLELKPIQEKDLENTDIAELAGIMVKYAKCCNPIPGDDIVGFVSRGSGVTIHRSDCVALKSLEQDRLMPISWGKNSGQNYVASVRLFVDNTPGVLATISGKIAENKINITKIVSTPSDHEEATIDISFYVSGKEELDDFIKKMQSLSIVHSVVRGGN